MEENIVEQAQEAVTVTEQPKTFTQEELDAIVANKIAEEKAKSDEAYKGLQKVITKKDQEIQSKKSDTSNLKILNLLEELADAKSNDDFDAVKKIGDKIKATKSEFNRNQAAEQLQAQGWEIQNMITSAGLDSTAPEFEKMRQFYAAGLVDLAKTEARETIARNTRKEEVKVEEKKPEVKVKSEAEIEAEIEARILKKYNLTKQDTGTPSGMGATREKAHADYAAGRITRSQYEAALK